MKIDFKKISHNEMKILSIHDEENKV